MKTPMIGSKHGVHCAGCRYSFDHYGMTADEGYKQDSRIYCNSDCALETEVAETESSDWAALSADY